MSEIVVVLLVILLLAAIINIAITIGNSFLLIRIFERVKHISETQMGEIESKEVDRGLIDVPVPYNLISRK